jgi:ADP-ribose pyrophosphatase YjhB (NUDIX family)
MDVRVQATSPIVRCIIIGEDDTVLLFRVAVTAAEAVECGEPKIAGMGHWDLPKGAPLKKEELVSAAQRIVYSKSGLFAKEVEELCPKPTKHQQVIFHAHHHCFVVRAAEGRFSRNEYQKGKEGVFQWIEYVNLSTYAIRKETRALIRLVFEGSPE